MKKVIIVAFLAVSMVGCTQLRNFWVKEEPVVKQDAKVIEQDLIDALQKPMPMPNNGCNVDVNQLK